MDLEKPRLPRDEQIDRGDERALQARFAELLRRFWSRSTAADNETRGLGADGLGTGGGDT